MVWHNRVDDPGLETSTNTIEAYANLIAFDNHRRDTFPAGESFQLSDRLGMKRDINFCECDASIVIVNFCGSRIGTVGMGIHDDIWALRFSQKSPPPNWTAILVSF